MKNTVEDLIKEKKGWNKEDFIFFWKIHKGKEVNKSCLSQWYPSEFIIKGRRYNCAEQYMMAQKALLFEDEESYKKIIASSEPKEIKALGREVKGFDPVKWDEEKYRIVREGNFAKFTQKQELRDYLVSTEGKILVEASPYDNMWGIGMAESNPDIFNPSKWIGQNLLGFILMDIRDEIIKRIPIPEFTTLIQDFTDETTGEIISVERRNYNSDYLASPSVLWENNLAIEEEYLKNDKPLSEEMKKLLYNHQNYLPHLKNIFNLTEKELEHEISKDSYVDTFSIEEDEGIGKFLVDMVVWNGLMASLQKEEIDSYGPFNSYSEALERGIALYIKIRTENEKMNLYSEINQILLDCDIDFESVLKEEVEFIIKNNIPSKSLYEYSIKQLNLIKENLENGKNNPKNLELIKNILRFILCQPIREEIRDIIKNNQQIFNVPIGDLHLTNWMVYYLMVINYEFFIYRYLKEKESYSNIVSWANGFHNQPQDFWEDGFNTFDLALYHGIVTMEDYKFDNQFVPLVFKSPEWLEKLRINDSNKK